MCYLLLAVNPTKPALNPVSPPRILGFKRFFQPQPLDFRALSIRGIGIRELMPPCMVERPKGTGDYLIMLFHDPSVVNTGPGGKLLKPPETMMIWPPGKGQYYGNPDRRFNHSWIHCDGSRVGRILHGAHLPVSKPFLVSNVSCFQQTLLDIHRELVAYMPADDVMMGNLLENCLREIARDINGAGQSLRIPENLLTVRNLISSVPSRAITLKELASLAGMSIPYFCSKFKNTFGLPPMECLIQHRMHRAAHLLSNRNLTVSEIAIQVGYEDPFHFSKLFKKHFGVSPRAMRERLAVSGTNQKQNAI